MNEIGKLHQTIIEISSKAGKEAATAKAMAIGAVIFSIIGLAMSILTVLLSR